MTKDWAEQKSYCISLFLAKLLRCQYHSHTKHLTKNKWPSVNTTLTAHFLCGLKSDLVICKLWEEDGWMDERCFRPLLCTVKAELGRGQPGLMIWEEDCHTWHQMSLLRPGVIKQHKTQTQATWTVLAGQQAVWATTQPVFVPNSCTAWLLNRSGQLYRILIAKPEWCADIKSAKFLNTHWEKVGGSLTVTVAWNPYGWAWRK